jgi:GT2 family glycosyltransferase
MGRARLAQDVSAVTGACLAVRRSVYESVGGLDDAFPVAFNDVDFCLRVRSRGLRVVWTPFAELVHHESHSRGSDLAGNARERHAAEREAFVARWGAILTSDPAYSPNLSLEREDFALAWPPRWEPPWRAGGGTIA